MKVTRFQEAESIEIFDISPNQKERLVVSQMYYNIFKYQINLRYIQKLVRLQREPPLRVLLDVFGNKRHHCLPLAPLGLQV